MSTYTSNVNRVTGLSGIDTESMVTSLMEAESEKLYSMQRNQKWTTWQQEAYREVISSIQDFQSTYLSVGSNSMRYSSTFNNYKNTVTQNGTESSAIKINSSKSSESFKLQVTSLAAAESFSGSQLKSTALKTSKTVDQITSNLGTLSFTVNLDGVSKQINVTKDDLSDGKTLTDALNEKLKSSFGSTGSTANVTASTDTNGYISFASSGNGHTLSISAGSTAADAVSVSFSSLYNSSDSTNAINLSKDADSDKYSFSFDLTVGSNTFTVSADDISASDIETNGSVDDKKVMALVANALNNATSGSGDATVSASSLFTVSSSSSALVFTNADKTTDTSIQINGISNSINLYKTNSLSDLGFSGTTTDKVSVTSKLSDIDSSFGTAQTININGTDVSISANETIKSLSTKLSKVGVDLSYSSATGTLTMTSSTSGAAGAIDFGDSNTTDFFGKLGLNLDKSDTNDSYTAGSDLKVKINGVETTRTSNTFDIGDMNITINDYIETDKTYEVKSEDDVDTTYDKIKSFVDAYNTLITDISSRTSETRSKSDSYSYYQPLTDDEEAALSETELEKWNAAAKTGLLYNDTTLNSMVSKLRSLMYSEITTTDGDKISLYSIGITTSSDYTKGGYLEIDEEKLKAAIAEKGDDIKQLFTQSDTGLGDQVKSIAESMVGTNGLLRDKAGIVGTGSVNENTLSKELEDIATKISDEQTRLYNKENYYYELFSAMEESVSNANSQLSVIQSLLG